MSKWVYNDTLYELMPQTREMFCGVLVHHQRQITILAAVIPLQGMVMDGL